MEPSIKGAFGKASSRNREINLNMNALRERDCKERSAGKTTEEVIIRLNLLTPVNAPPL
jgi:hypothetical protein|tara:strand:+ start:1354 stop:1530 length:177 start_codon:yes stop_codon:yes gene_type:complete